MTSLDPSWVGETFDHNDPAQIGPDPYRLYRELREACPVGESKQHGGFQFLLRYRDIAAVAHQPALMSNFPGSIPPVPVPRPMIPLQIDPPAHKGYRAMLNPIFTPQKVLTVEPAVRAYAARLVQDIVDRGEGDVVSEFADLLPVFALSQMFSIPEERGKDFQTWAHDVSSTDPELAVAAALALASTLGDLLAKRRADPIENDLMSELACGQVRGRPVTDDEALDMCMILVLAGVHTTTSAIAASIRLLGQRPDLRQELLSRPELMSTAVEELLRYDGPAQSTARTAVGRCSLAGMELDQGDNVLLVWASANRDPEEFLEPDEVHLDRSPNRHLAFGIGIHRCLGAQLARLEFRVALEEFLRGVPDYELLDDLAEPEKWAVGIIRSAIALPIKVGAGCGTRSGDDSATAANNSAGSDGDQ